MSSLFFLQVLRGAALAAVLGASSLPAVSAERVATRYEVDLPPSADLHYTIKASQKGFSIAGDALVSWRRGEGKYSLNSDTRAALFGKLIDNRSHGLIDAYGIAPVEFFEKRIRHDPWTTTFHRDSKTITFTESKLSYPLKGGEQDRSTAPWQLLSIARANPDKFTPGSEWTLFVAGRRDAEPWTFRVLRPETIRTGIGQVETIHLSKTPPADSKDQDVDIWLAPSQDWFPVRLRFTDSENEFVEQTLDKITRK